MTAITNKRVPRRIDRELLTTKDWILDLSKNKPKTNKKQQATTKNHQYPSGIW